ncbi:MAG TPA: phytanoyl-CoA dioxygenase family protein [Vicinamibacterales bacterium]|nr:phytanoyl-CoA dioxygenase family protein [Vicinamibacterales bacterium]
MSIVIESGYQVLPQVLSQATIAALRGAIEDSINRAARAMLTPFQSSRPDVTIDQRLESVARTDRAYASALLQTVMADAQHDPRIASLPNHDGLAVAIGERLIPELPSGHVVRTRAAIPSFTSQISPWHQDVIRPQEAHGCASVRLAAWIPLADVDAKTGALEVLPGQWEAPCPHENHGGHFQIPADQLPAIEPRCVPMRAGDVLLLDRYVPHRALPTHGLQCRWAIVMWVKAGGAATAC